MNRAPADAPVTDKASREALNRPFELRLAIVVIVAATAAAEIVRLIERMLVERRSGVEMARPL